MVNMLESGVVDLTPVPVQPSVTRAQLEAQIVKLSSFETTVGKTGDYVESRTGKHPRRYGALQSPDRRPRQIRLLQQSRAQAHGGQRLSGGAGNRLRQLRRGHRRRHLSGVLHAV